MKVGIYRWLVLLLFECNVYAVFCQENLHEIQFIKPPAQSTISNIRDIKQDPYGFIWIATQDGLFRFDSKTFKIYNTNQPGAAKISGSDVRTIAIDTAGGLVWIATSYGGLNAISLETGNVVMNFSQNDIRELNQNLIKSLLIGKSGSIILGCEKGMFVLNSLERKLTKIDLDLKDLHDPYIDMIYRVDEKILLIGCRNFGLVLFDQTVGKVIKKIADEDWVRRSLDQFKPMKFGKRLWICPSWFTPPEPNDVNIILDPGLAFGTGTHPTTALCLEWLDEHINAQHLVIDYGCGSGILSLAALKLGAKRVFAVDNDEQALEATLRNGEKNGFIPPELQTYLPNELPVEQADLLIANILAQPLIELAPLFAKRVKPHGKLILSGILPSQTEEITKAYSPWFNMQPPDFKEEWSRISGNRID